MIKNTLILSALAFAFFAFKSDKKAYQLFSEEGKKVHYSQLLEAAKKADVILFGEYHDNPIDHWLEKELTRDLYAEAGNNLVLSAEMFEADDQIVLDEYLAGEVTEKTFRDEAKIWPNYSNDYKPLLDFAYNHKLKFVAANIPRRYASMVYFHGLEKLDSINPEAKKWMAPLPIPYDDSLKCYAGIYKAAGHGGKNLPKSQAIKDATMAYFILKNYFPGKIIINFNGSYHSDWHEGIEWYLKQYDPKLKVVTIASVEQDSVNSLGKENLGRASFIICTPSSMSKTFQP